jgi:hypothetical protein
VMGVKWLAAWIHGTLNAKSRSMALHGRDNPRMTGAIITSKRA